MYLQLQLFFFIMLAIYLLVAGKEKTKKMRVRETAIVTTFKDASNEDKNGNKEAKINGNIRVWHKFTLACMIAPMEKSHCHAHRPPPTKQHLKIKLCNPVSIFGWQKG